METCTFKDYQYWYQNSYKHSIHEFIHDTFGSPKFDIKETYIYINNIAIYYTIYILLHKRILENNQPFTKFQDPP